VAKIGNSGEMAKNFAKFSAVRLENREYGRKKDQDIESVWNNFRNFTANYHLINRKGYGKL
jgi:hypothetical protein